MRYDEQPDNAALRVKEHENRLKDRAMNFAPVTDTTDAACTGCLLSHVSAGGSPALRRRMPPATASRTRNILHPFSGRTAPAVIGRARLGRFRCCPMKTPASGPTSWPNHRQSPHAPLEGRTQFRQVSRRAPFDGSEIALIASGPAGSSRRQPQGLPKPPKFPEGWQLGEPDLVLKMSEPFAVPAGGRMSIAAS